MKVKTISEFLEIPIGSVGDIVTQQGDPIDKFLPGSRAMWIKFDCKDMPVGIPEDFSRFIKYED